MSETLTGKVLIASRALRDPNFFRSAVLIIRHGEDGALGLVINRPSGNKAAQALQKHLHLPHPEQAVFYGGPVEPTALFLIHDAGGEASWEVVEGVYVGTSPEAYNAVVAAAKAGRDVAYRVFVGCAGWAPEQLESELFRNDWYMQDATREIALAADPYKLWQEMLASALASHRLLRHVATNPELN
jgi:putative transcriptional regulator